MQSSNLRVPSEAADPPLAQVGKVALTFLADTRQEARNQAVLIFHHMAQMAVERGHSHQHIEFESAALKEVVAPQALKEPSAWLSPQWKRLEVYQEEWAQGIHATAVRMGYKFVPNFKKLLGSPAKYRLEAEPIRDEGSEGNLAQTPEGGLRYTPAAVAAPGALLLAGLRNGVMRHTLPLIISTSVVAGLLTLFLLGSSWLIVVTGLRMHTPVTTAQLTLAVVLCLAVWLSRRFFHFLGSLADLGIVMAPEVLVPFKEDHVTLELRPRVGDKKGEFAFVRYTSICPLCSGQVLLHEGGAEFTGRIVGRCGNSPREHVFSFDQKLHIGQQLRGLSREQVVKTKCGQSPVPR